MIPGSAIANRSRNEIDSLPKNENLLIAKAAIDPSTSAIAVASRPTFTESQSELRTSGSLHATRNQCSVQPGIGQLWMLDLLNAKTTMISSGIQRKAMTSADHAPSPNR